jgi:hypothetical protein
MIQRMSNNLAQLNKKGRSTIDGREVIVTPRDEARSYFLGVKDGEIKYRALKNYIWLTWPEFTKGISVENGRIKADSTNKWNPWLERHLRAFCNTSYAKVIGDTTFRFIGLTGAGGAGKTHASGLFAVAWWQMSPFNSIAILTSTTVGMIRHRIWPVIDHYAQNSIDMVSGKPCQIGHMVGSQLELRADKGDAKHAIFALAVAHGETQKAIHNLKGMHAERILLIIDEANGTPEAIFETIPNLSKGALDITVIIIGNPFARLDPHGRAITPLDGWGSVGENTMQWESKAVPEWGLESGLVLRFDGKDSPNVKANKNLYPYIYTLDNWQSDNHPLKIGTFAYWTQCRGLHPPDGFQSTVFNEQLFIRCEYDGHFTFTSDALTVAFMDTAFGGDACILRFAVLGNTENGKQGLQLTDWMELTFEVSENATDIDYQVARRFIQECKKRHIEPRCAGLDATGTGRGVAAIVAAEWSPEIQCVEFGGAPSERPSAQNDGRPAKEVYANMVAELWFSVREALEAGQMKGFSRESVLEFCSRMFDPKMPGKKYKLETKSDLQARVRYSPDHGDCDVGILEVARRNGFVISGRVAQTANNEWNSALREVQRESALITEPLLAGAEGGGWGETLDVAGGWD